MKNFIYKLFTKLHLIKDGAGFTQLMYRGRPVILRDDMPPNTVGFINEKTARVRILNWRTKKIRKLMTFKQFYAWIAKNTKK